MRRGQPDQLRQDMAKPREGQKRDRAERAGETTPGWKISNLIPAIPARKSSGIRFVDQRSAGA